MKRGRVYLLIFLLGAVALSLAGPSIYAYFVAERFSGALAQAIQTAAATKNPWPGRVDLAKFPGPAWDAVHIFGPYTPPEQIDADLGFRCRDRDAKRLSMSEAENLLVFIKGRTVVMSVLFPRRSGDFAPDARRLKYLPDEAVFTVGTEDGRPVLKPGTYSRDMARVLERAPWKPYVPSDPDWAAFELRMRPKLGQRVTASGVPRNGVESWWLPLEGHSVHIRGHRAEIDALLEQARQRNETVTLRGTLRFHQGSRIDDPRVVVSAVPPIFYFDAADVGVSSGVELPK